VVLYLTVEQLIAINAAQDGGVGVANPAGVEQNAARPQSRFGGIETFPDLWSKAAAYVHGISSTQYFTDGNKRTAWLAMNVFLDANGSELPYIPEIEAETFVQAIAQKVFDTDEDRDATVRKAAEWLRSKFESTNALGRNERLDWAVLGLSFTQHEHVDGIMDAEKMGIASAAVSATPAELEVHLALRCHFLPVDRGISQEFDVKIEYAAEEVARISKYTFPIDVGLPPPSGHAHHPYGLMPTMITGGLRVEILKAGTLRFVVTLNGRLLTKLPLTVHVLPDMIPGHNFDELPAWLPK
jgi:death-on-curing protein